MHETAKYPTAITNVNYYISQAAHPNKAEAFALLAYINLCTESGAIADDYIKQAQGINEKNPLLLLVQACRAAVNKNEAEALTNLESALIPKVFTKKEIEDEKLLKNIRKADRYKVLIANYFK